MNRKKIKIRYYSGSGNTQYVAETFEKAFLKMNCCVDLKNISSIECEEKTFCDRWVVFFPVHAFDSPEGIYDWIKCLSPETKRSVAVISVSGGGEMGPNKGSRYRVIHLLEKKGATVFYENMVVMPSNIFISTDPVIEKLLLQILPKVGTAMVAEMLTGEVRRNKVGIGYRALSATSKIEKKGAKWFGKSIQVKDSCISCGWCSQACPSGNIEMAHGKPIFKSQCHLCLKCIYGCPTQSLYPKYGKSFVLKDGYQIEKIKKSPSVEASCEWQEKVKGILWVGVKKYIEKWKNY